MVRATVLKKTEEGELALRRCGHLLRRPTRGTRPARRAGSGASRRPSCPRAGPSLKPQFLTIARRLRAAAADVEDQRLARLEHRAMARTRRTTGTLSTSYSVRSSGVERGVRQGHVLRSRGRSPGCSPCPSRGSRQLDPARVLDERAHVALRVEQVSAVAHRARSADDVLPEPRPGPSRRCRQCACPRPTCTLIEPPGGICAPAGNVSRGRRCESRNHQLVQVQRASGVEVRDPRPLAR